MVRSPKDEQSGSAEKTHSGVTVKKGPSLRWSTEEPRDRGFLSY